ncbi:unnamed protein product [Cyprideis torosa]|uniref:Uncharacterized protein n=1 Tax=Cyprideis torosa TaxID=163714 RepID=A0A7R8W5T9_9CRUS|nr:unnamed protein product [Cyprideis torosa]CAG0880208.1 unnamed protein product [Cyprideis torosa]
MDRKGVSNHYSSGPSSLFSSQSIPSTRAMGTQCDFSRNLRVAGGGLLPQDQGYPIDNPSDTGYRAFGTNLMDNGYILMDPQHNAVDVKPPSKSIGLGESGNPNFNFEGVQMLPPRELLEQRAEMIRKQRLREMALITGKHFMAAIERDFAQREINMTEGQVRPLTNRERMIMSRITPQARTAVTPGKAKSTTEFGTTTATSTSDTSIQYNTRSAGNPSLSHTNTTSRRTYRY